MEQYNLKKTVMLEGYRDKCYVNNILCQMSFEYYNRIKSIISVPLILSTSIMTILNSSDIKPSDMKVANIVLNGMTVLILALTNNFKFAEKASNFRSLSLKYNKLCHFIEDKLAYEIDNVSVDVINEIIKEYDSFNELLEYPFPNSIKDIVRKTYKNKKKLPNILNCTTEFSCQSTPHLTYENAVLIKDQLKITKHPYDFDENSFNSNLESFKKSIHIKADNFVQKNSFIQNKPHINSFTSSILFEDKLSPIIFPCVDKQYIKPITESIQTNPRTKKMKNIDIV